MKIMRNGSSPRIGLAHVVSRTLEKGCLGYGWVGAGGGGSCPRSFHFKPWKAIFATINFFYCGFLWWMATNWGKRPWVSSFLVFQRGKIIWCNSFCVRGGSILAGHKTNTLGFARASLSIAFPRALEWQNFAARQGQSRRPLSQHRFWGLCFAAGSGFSFELWRYSSFPADGVPLLPLGHFFSEKRKNPHPTFQLKRSCH